MLTNIYQKVKVRIEPFILIATNFTDIPTDARIQKICPKGSSFDKVYFSFLVNEGREDPNTTISGLPSARQRNAI